MIEKFHEAERGPDHVRALFHHGDATGAEHGASSGHGFKIELDVEVVRREEWR